MHSAQLLLICHLLFLVWTTLPLDSISKRSTDKTNRSLDEHPSLVSHGADYLQGIDRLQNFHFAESCLHQNEHSRAPYPSTAGEERVVGEKERYR